MYATSSTVFEVVESTRYYDVMYHKDSKVMYLVSRENTNGGGGIFTMMLDADGRPQLYEE